MAASLVRLQLLRNAVKGLPVGVQPVLSGLPDLCFAFREGRSNKTNHLGCGSDISFEEFLQFVVTHKRVAYDDHWRPAYTLCSPCLFQPHVIGKMETFAQDVQYVLRVMNSSWMVQGSGYSRHQHALKLSRRLWQAFQINGYLPSDRPFPDHQTNAEISAEQFISLVQKTYRETAKNSSSEWTKQQKERMMLEAYQTSALRLWTN